MHSVGILFPAYNEEETIGIVVRDAKKFFPNSVIVVIDDGSSDETATIAEKFGAVVIRHESNMGKGEALKTGFEFFLEHTRAKYIIVADADGQYSIKDGVGLLVPLKNDKADVVVGMRNWKDVPFLHRLGNAIWRITFNLLFGTHLRDTNCGFMAFNRRALKLIEHTGGGYIIENSLIIEALRKGLRITQVPVNVYYKRVSPFLRGVRMVLGILIFIIREGINYRIKSLKSLFFNLHEKF